MTFSPKAIEAAADFLRSSLDDDYWRKGRAEEFANGALTAALAVDGVALQGWQPIESAPINRAILIKTSAPDYYGNSGIYEAMLVDIGNGRRWATFGHGVGRDLGCDWKPTHWMPLPPPPAASDREERR